MNENKIWDILVRSAQATSHKPLIPMFSRACSKLPPRIQKWIMEMQDVNYEIVYEPGKDSTDLMGYLSRYPLPNTERDDTEQTIKAIISNEHGVVMKRITEASASVLFFMMS